MISKHCGVTAIPMMTLGFSPTALQIYIGIVYIYSALLHANRRGDFHLLGAWLATPRFHHWHHGLEKEATDVNFAIHFPFWDRLFGTYFLPVAAGPRLWYAGGGAACICRAIPLSISAAVGDLNGVPK